jgi:hypothetical protein
MRTIRARKPDNAKADREFSLLVKRRDGYECKMQVWHPSQGVWLSHGIKGSPVNPLDAAHVYGRPHIPPAVRFDPIVGTTACRDCHAKYDSRDDSVRVNPLREELAYSAIFVAAKVPPPRRLPQESPAC